MNTPNSKLTPEQIAAGWIESEEFLSRNLAEKGHFDVLDKNGYEYMVVKNYDRWMFPNREYFENELKNFIIAYRPVPRWEEVEQLVSMNNGLSVQLIHAKNEADELREQLAASNGKTLRDEIAIAAMNGMVSDFLTEKPSSSIVTSNHRQLAAKSYLIADAMLEARKGGGE